MSSVVLKLDESGVPFVIEKTTDRLLEDDIAVLIDILRAKSQTMKHATKFIGGYLLVRGGSEWPSEFASVRKDLFPERGS